MSLPEIGVTAVFATMTVLTFILFAADKFRAKHGKWRIRESVLLGCGFLLGGVGGLLGMAICRHKTKHARFLILMPLFALLSLIVVAATYAFT